MPATLNDIQRKYGEGKIPLYKDEMFEPFEENESGIGYKGVVMYDELEDKVQCSVCGKWLKIINPLHLRIHDISNAEEYKDIYGLSLKTPLTSVGESRRRSRQAKRLNPLAKAKGKTRKDASFETRSKAMRKARSKSQFKNKNNLCDAQIVSRIKVVADIVGKQVEELKSGDIKKYDSKLYKTIGWRGESMANVCKKYKINLSRLNANIKDSQIIAMLRKWVLTNKRMPVRSDLDHNSIKLAHGTIDNHFGSWRRAKMMAGLDQLLAEVKESK